MLRSGSSNSSSSGGGSGGKAGSSSSSVVSGKSDDGKLKCRFCEKKCDTKGKLTQHENVHTKPFECDTCGNRFATGYERKVHQRVHTGEKPFKCSICGVGFSRVQHCHRHERNVHKDDEVSGDKVKSQGQTHGKKKKSRRRTTLKKDEPGSESDSEVKVELKKKKNNSAEEAEVASEDEETYLNTYGERFRRFWRQTEEPLCILGKATVNRKELYLVRLKIPGEPAVTSGSDPYTGLTNDNFVLVYADKFKNWFPQLAINFMQEGLVLVDVEETPKENENSKDSDSDVNDEVKDDDDEEEKVSELPKDEFGLPVLDGVDEPLDEFGLSDYSSSDDEEDLGIRRLLEGASPWQPGAGGHRKKKCLRLLSDDDE